MIVCMSGNSKPFLKSKITTDFVVNWKCQFQLRTKCNNLYINSESILGNVPLIVPAIDQFKSEINNWVPIDNCESIFYPYNGFMGKIIL